MLARLRELAALLLDFVEQPRVLDGDARPGRRRSCTQFDLLFGERPRLLAASASERRSARPRATSARPSTARKPPAAARPYMLYSGSAIHVGMWMSLASRTARPAPVSRFMLDRQVLDVVYEFLRIAEGDASVKFVTASSCVMVPWSASHSLRRRTQQRVEHGLQIESRAADDLEHIGGCGLLRERFGQVVGAPLHLIEQPYVLDRNHRLIGEGRDQLDLLGGERPTSCRQMMIAPIRSCSLSIGTATMDRKPPTSTALTYPGRRSI